MEWFAIIIPILAFIVCLIGFKKFVTPIEFLGLLLIPIIVIAISYTVCVNINISDKLYQSEIIVKARYIEPYETWITKECSETYSCNCSTDANGKETCQTCTRYYDCSYCDYNSEQFIATTENGRTFNITEKEYNRLKNKWNSKPQFVELNRDIDYSGGCGKDGDAYDIFWNPTDIYNSEIATWTKEYNNRTVSANSVFHYPNISNKEAKKIGLYDYPKIYNQWNQWNILGSEYLIVTPKTKDTILSLYNYFNGYYGYKNKIHLFVLIFQNKSIDVAFQQEAYWNGGNENEVVLCIGVDKNNNISWCKPFSWCDEKLPLVNLRNAVIEQKRLNLINLYPIITKEITTYYKYKNLDKDFEYITIDLTQNEILFIWILTLIVTIGLCIWFIKNDSVN